MTVVQSDKTVGKSCRSAALTGLLLAVSVATGQAQITSTRYQEDVEAIPNPEQGFYYYANLRRLDPEIGRIRERGLTLVWGKIDLESYRQDERLPESCLDEIRAGFQIARDQGVKVIVRGSYGHRGPDGDYRSFKDPPAQHVRNHIQQLQPVFAENTDVIALFEAGFVGPWGEWHGTQIARDYDRGREMLHFILEHTPRERMVVVRYPYLKQQIFRLPGGSFEKVNAENAYSGLPVARVGHHNDCFLSSATDVGTYDRGGTTREDETAYLSQETLYTVFGGETCRAHKLNDGANAIQELETLHGTYLNSGYHPDVLQKWKRQGAFQEIQRRLGARFVLTESRVSSSAKPGGTLGVECDLKNVGFAALYNPRSVELVLAQDPADQQVRGTALHFDVQVDPRQWKPGNSYTLRRSIALPVDLPRGTYSLYLNLPAPEETLRKDPRYSIRLANKSLWQPATGFNTLVAGIEIH